MTSYDPEAAARAARAAQAERQQQPALAVGSAVRDPLPYCIYATICLIGWLITPPLALACFASLGAYRYWRAWRAGLRASDCILGDPRRVIAYLLLLASGGAAASAWSLWQWLS